MVVMSEKENGSEDYSDTSVIAKNRPKVKRPPLYKVLLLNDDFTPMEFVVHILELFFTIDRENATRIMLEVHTSGKGVCGLFTHEIAETKVNKVTELARAHDYPLRCSMEPAE